MLWMILGLYIGFGLLLIALAQPLIEGKVKPNGWYGVRTPKTLSNEDVWYKANAYGGRVLRVMGIVTAGASVILLPLNHFSLDVYALTCAGVMFVSMLWMAFVILKYIQKL
jgi:uncharacterized membrane protein